MQQRWLIPSTALMVLLAAAAPAHAQLGQRNALVAAGVEPQYTTDGGTFRPALTGSVALEWGAPARRLGVRGGLLGFRHTGASGSRLTLYGAEVLGTISMRRSGVRPYLLGGLGLYHASLEVPGAILVPFAEWQAGVSGGIGLGFPAGGVEPFIETRLLFMSSDRPIDTLLPIHFGLRF